MKKNKGFTLIELMIAIAIIGILALVLIPRVAGMKTQAKLSGINTNLNIAQGVIESLITDYEPDDAGVTGLESAIASRLNITDPTKGAKNPITGALGVGDYDPTTPVPNNGDKAFVYDSDVSEPKNAALADPASLNSPNMRGVIYIHAYYTGTPAELKVELLPYDDQGNYMVGKRREITK